MHQAVHGAIEGRAGDQWYSGRHKKNGHGCFVDPGHTFRVERQHDGRNKAAQIGVWVEE